MDLGSLVQVQGGKFGLKEQLGVKKNIKIEVGRLLFSTCSRMHFESWFCTVSRLN